MTAALSETDREHLRRCVALAEQALLAGCAPFGSVLVGGDGVVLFEDRNRTGGDDATRHPEIELARWAANHLFATGRATATVYTSGEHCAMCSAAHGLVGLGRIVIASSTPQLTDWLAELGVQPGPVRPLRVTDVVPGQIVDGPDPELAEQVHGLHRRAHTV